ncbi:ABC transporter ATP-binding protein [Candidatus Endoriftia persephone]|jgi:phospholipid/cholesterol/gamma-HCH transport system ATP-binding protein|uniref:ATP-binding cassette domain-containing protein n=3 Tax=Gammaproteobacteria TaxID=1236 RepID=A0A9J6ZVJ9_9GAMM|nr:ATP-binding cassette domain-containing protein [Candidatus Endoriftia persephone]EGW55618.1 putative ribonucleotide transport ATP-binding protein Mkl [endosymbiont of Tevnia jerichonana (vent Tica)]USF86762.1 ATP-binding cassette domain-containing protein [Candidatus Endoriftia persephone]
MTMQADSDGRVVEVEGLEVHYGNHKVLDGIDLQVNAGEIMVIMGGSGSGKSTLLRTLLGLKEASAGSVKLLGKPFDARHPENLRQVRRRIGVAFQGGALLSSLTVGENIRLPLRHHARLDESTMAVMTRMKLEMVNLPGTENLMPAQLSGGMVKRAALARALIMDPALMFFDEPSAGLDPVTSAELDELILRLRDTTGTTIVVVTHELESTFSIADRITMLGGGKVLMSGSVDEVRNSSDPQIQNLLNRRPNLEQPDPDAYLRRLTGN